MSYNSFIGKIEFYKDGGWGIGNEEGLVVVKNHLKEQPSKSKPLFNRSNTPFRIIQDTDTKKLGVLSLSTFIETIHCHYNKIVALEFYEGSIKHYYIKVEKHGKWGCFDENCALIIDCMYDDIHLTNGFLECTRNGEYLMFDTLNNKGYDSILEGKKDLYNGEGILLLGGYNNLVVGYDYLQFYFGTYYEHYNVEEIDSYGYPYMLSKLRLNYEHSLCLLLDKDFKTIIQNEKGFYKIPKGIVIDSLEKLQLIVPPGLLFKYRVDLSHFNNGFIYLHNFYGEEYFIPYYIAYGYDSPKDMENYPYYIDRNDIYKDDEIVTIVRLNEERVIVWEDNVNEVDVSSFNLTYRRSNKVGVYNENGLGKSLYDAITIDNKTGKTYIAMINRNSSPKNELNNPNYVHSKGYSIEYYGISNDGKYCRIEDNWKIFNPSEYKWFPEFFKEDNELTDFYIGSCYPSEDNDYEWTDEDSWDAMTDGMYGDYPGSEWDPEMLGF